VTVAGTHIINTSFGDIDVADSLKLKTSFGASIVILDP
jgi:hypothetical protein